VKDRFRNTSRDNMPEDETMTRFGDRLIALTKLNLKERGGAFLTTGGKNIYRIRLENPANVEALPDLKAQYSSLRSQWKGEIEKGIARGQGDREKALAAYLAICLDFAPEMRQRYGERWESSVAALNGYPKVLQALFYESPIPAGEALAAKAIAAGVRKPAQSIKIWV
jgi:hypothetical protein